MACRSKECQIGDCSKCESCKFDAPIDTPFNRHNKMKHDNNFGILPVNNNPSTAQIILLNKGTNKSAVSCYCNGCDFLESIERPGQNTFNCRCKLAKMVGAGNVSRIIKLKVYRDEKIQKPFWCPVGNESVRKSLNLPATPKLSLPLKTSMMSDEQMEKWKKSEEKQKLTEKWLAISGLMSWGDITVGKKYHLPPSLKKGRADIEIRSKYPCSIFAVNIKTHDNVWLYKEDEDYKFLSEIEKQ